MDPICTHTHRSQLKWVRNTGLVYLTAGKNTGNNKKNDNSELAGFIKVKNNKVESVQQHTS